MVAEYSSDTTIQLLVEDESSPYHPTSGGSFPIFESCRVWPLLKLKLAGLLPFSVKNHFRGIRDPRCSPVSVSCEARNDSPIARVRAYAQVFPWRHSRGPAESGLLPLCERDSCLIECFEALVKSSLRLGRIICRLIRLWMYSHRVSPGKRFCLCR